MRPSSSLSKCALGVLAVLASGCSHPRWREMAAQAATLRTMRVGAGVCEEPTRLKNAAFEVRCGESTVFVRCGYHHGDTCCWPVDSRNAAVGAFERGRGKDQVCGPQ